MIKALNNLHIEGMYLNIEKAVYNKLTANIILKGEKLFFSSKIRSKTGVSTLATKWC